LKELLIDKDVRQVFWSTSGTLVAITSEDSYYILRFDRAAYQAALDSGVDIGDEGCEEAFEVVCEISERCVELSCLPFHWAYTTGSEQRQDC
jgi:coatomer subunit beta'